MTRTVVLKAVVAVAVALALTVGSASAQQRIGPNQWFHGVVNGSTVSAPVYVVCPGPVFPGERGHPFNDSWQVELGGSGFTGSAANSIVARFTADTSAGSVFTEYGVSQSVPPSLLLPCSGTGTAVFTPEPTSPTARSATVTVRFINIAV